MIARLENFSSCSITDGGPGQSDREEISMPGQSRFEMSADYAAGTQKSKMLVVMTSRQWRAAWVPSAAPLDGSVLEMCN